MRSAASIGVGVFEKTNAAGEFADKRGTPTRLIVRFAHDDPPSPLLACARGGGIRSSTRSYTSFTFFSGRLRTGFPVAAKIAFITEGVTTQMVGSPTPPQKS